MASARRRPRRETDAAKIEWPIDLVVRRQLSELKDWPGNPKTHSRADVEALAGDMARVGWTYPMVIEERDFILAGHRRKLAALHLGWAEGPTIQLLGLTEDEKRAEVIRDNKRGLDSPFDDLLLKRELGILRANNFDLRLAGYTEQELAAIAKPSDFLAGMLTGGDVHDGNEGIRPAARGVAIRFDMLPADRDHVVAWLAGERDRRKLRTSAEALVAIAREKRK